MKAIINITLTVLVGFGALFIMKKIGAEEFTQGYVMGAVTSVFGFIIALLNKED